MLLCVGASLKLRGLQASYAMAIAAGAKLVCFQLVIPGAGAGAGLPPLDRTGGGWIYGALPHRSGGYTLRSETNGRRTAPLIRPR